MSDNNNSMQEISNYLFVNLEENDKDIIITIKDNGGGIFAKGDDEHNATDKELEQIFAPYFTTKHQSEGTGIGMYMTYQIIVKHYEGNIKVSNQQYKYENHDFVGAEFRITLPKNTSKNNQDIKY
jgi:C4-dicarboxylate-specific signal transduction histidine kinase